MNKVTDMKTAVVQVKRGDTLMLGGFSPTGCPYNLLYELKEHPEINDLTVISSDMGYGWTSYPQGQDMLVVNNQVREMIVSYLGKNKKVNAFVAKEEVKLTLVPQGTLVERIRAAGAGLGGFYTPTGVGTVVEEGKESKVINGKKYLLELPLRADVAFLKAQKADRLGNAVFRYTSKNFNLAMATAADIVILEVEEIVECGALDPDQVSLPGIFVDHIVLTEEVVF